MWLESYIASSKKQSALNFTEMFLNERCQPQLSFCLRILEACFQSYYYSTATESEHLLDLVIFVATYTCLSGMNHSLSWRSVMSLSFRFNSTLKSKRSKSKFGFLVYGWPRKGLTPFMPNLFNWEPNSFYHVYGNLLCL